MASKGGVHISYLVVAVVICLGLVGVVFMQNGKVEQAKQDAVTAKEDKSKAEANQRKQYLELVQARRLLIGPDGEDSTPDYDGLNALLSKAGEELAKSDAARSAQGFESMQGYIETSFPVIVSWRERYENSQTETEAQSALAEERERTRREHENLAQETERTLRSEKNDVTQELERAQADAAATEERLREDLENREEELSAEIAKLVRDLRIQSNLRKRAEDRLERLLEERRIAQTFDKVDPDGEIVQVSEELGFAWIDLGRKHRLEAGTVFDVFQFVKGGQRKPKGKVEVVKVDGDMAQVSITHLLDDLDPMLPGDKIVSPFYSPDDKPIFVLAGSEMSTRRISVDELKRRIERFGGVLQEDVSISTGFVVCLRGYEESDEYRDARQLGVTVLSEDQILSFIGQ